VGHGQTRRLQLELLDLVLGEVRREPVFGGLRRPSHDTTRRGAVGARLDPRLPAGAALFQSGRVHEQNMAVDPGEREGAGGDRVELLEGGDASV
jgi:hypothetical protein